ncbi:MAG: SUF system NifU family Fe-S cluster assembly protein [Rhodospirillaceae bacterium]|nr:MAG: SUF system NifU family Fe-S cluster assembly protein [Rhodospirillaceae bacterium]
MSALTSRRTEDSADDLKALYQELILDHGKSPRNLRPVEHPTCTAKGNNPMCGDKVTVSARVSEAGVIEDIAFEGRGCAISIASASMMTLALKGRTVDGARRLFAAVQGLCTGRMELTTAKAETPVEMSDALDELAALSGVRQFPVRVKCATLPWHALVSCLDGSATATTES